MSIYPKVVGGCEAEVVVTGREEAKVRNGGGGGLMSNSSCDLYCGRQGVKQSEAGQCKANQCKATDARLKGTRGRARQDSNRRRRTSASGKKARAGNNRQLL